MTGLQEELQCRFFGRFVVGSQTLCPQLVENPQALVPISASPFHQTQAIRRANTSSSKPIPLSATGLQSSQTATCNTYPTPYNPIPFTLSIYLPVHPSIHPSIHPSVYLSIIHIYIYVCMYVCTHAHYAKPRTQVQDRIGSGVRRFVGCACQDVV